MNICIIIFSIVFIAIIAIIGLICWLLSLITRKLNLSGITNFLKVISELVAIVVIFMVAIFVAIFMVWSIFSFVDYGINFLLGVFL